MPTASGDRAVLPLNAPVWRAPISMPRAALPVGGPGWWRRFSSARGTWASASSGRPRRPAAPSGVCAGWSSPCVAASAGLRHDGLSTDRWRWPASSNARRASPRECGPSPRGRTLRRPSWGSSPHGGPPSPSPRSSSRASRAHLLEGGWGWSSPTARVREWDRSRQAPVCPPGCSARRSWRRRAVREARSPPWRRVESAAHERSGRSEEGTWHSSTRSRWLPPAFASGEA